LQTSCAQGSADRKSVSVKAAEPNRISKVEKPHREGCV
jgi:hypothetical protein